MKTVLRSLALAGLVGFTGCADGASRRAADASDPLILRAHFIGSTQLFSDSNSAKLKEIWTLPGSVAFRNEALDRFAHLPMQLFGSSLPKGAADHAAEFRPLLEDLLANESYSDFRATEMVIAVKLTEARGKAWDAALRKASGAWKLGNIAPVTSDGFTGWEIKRSEAPQLFRVGRAGEWTVISAGPEKLSLAAPWIAAIKAQGRPAKATGAWLEGDANLARFDRVLPAIGRFDNAPIARFSLSNRADFVRTLVKLDFPKPHNWKAEPWRIPTNSIFDPLSSFMVARGIAPLIESIPLFQQVGWKPTPNQICGWGVRSLPFQFFYTTPVSSREITNQLHRLAPKLQSTIFEKNGTNLLGQIAVATNQTDIYWKGLPMAVPRLSPLRGDSNLLLFEMFPPMATRTKAPPELFQQLSRDNLVYYDWEITQDRIPSWRQMYQLADIATRRNLTPTNAPSWRFSYEAAAKLGESVTEITVASPTQMTLIRKSHSGLSSFELVTLSRWLESTNFPAFGIFPPPSMRPTSRTRPSSTSPAK